MKLPFTTHEASLIDQINTEIRELNEDISNFNNQMENANTKAEAELFFNRIKNLSKGIKIRSELREGIYKLAKQRLFKD